MAPQLVPSQAATPSCEEAGLQVAAQVREIRRARHLSQRQLAGRMQVPRTYISKIENGKAIPTLGSLERLALALGVDISQLVRDCTEPSRRRGRGHLCRIRFWRRLPGCCLSWTLLSGRCFTGQYATPPWGDAAPHKDSPNLSSATLGRSLALSRSLGSAFPTLATERNRKDGARTLCRSAQLQGTGACARVDGVTPWPGCRMLRRPETRRHRSGYTILEFRIWPPDRV